MSIYLFIIIISISLLGLLGIQFYFYNQSIDYKKQLFEQNAKFALRTSVYKIQKLEFLELIKNHKIHHPGLSSDFFEKSNKVIKLEISSNKNSDSFLKVKQITIDRINFNNTGKSLSQNYFKKNTNKIIFQKFFDQALNSKNKIQFYEDFENELKRMNISLKKRIHPKLIDSVLKSEFNSNGITLPFVFQVHSENLKNIIYSSGQTTDLIFNEKLYPNDLFGEQGFLRVSFPNQNSFIYGNFSLIAICSLSFLFIVVFSFSFILIKMIQQRKISLLKTDFINNMTHEFKTPVSTIMLASEALMENKKSINNDRLNNLVEVINKENIRLSNHIERVLNMTRLEEEDFQLEKKPIDMNEIIHAAIQSLQLQIENKNAKINIDFKSTKNKILGDATHLQNVIINLIDNSLKYSSEIPVFNISSEDAVNGIILKFKDNGIGINKEIQTKIFEKFIREERGNIHNIKGFGLGLSYVKSVIDKMGGSITLHSEKNIGAEFVVFIPL